MSEQDAQAAQTGAGRSESRYAPPSGVVWRRLLEHDSAVAMVEPTLENQAIQGRAQEVLWAVLLPAWCTGCTIHVLRRVARYATDKSLLEEDWVEEDTLVVTANKLHLQYGLDDLLYVYVTAILGVHAPGQPIRIRYKLVNKGV